MVPTSHHLAFAVQYITVSPFVSLKQHFLTVISFQLSGVLLLRCIAYVKEPSLVNAIIGDAEKCIRILEGMEEIWPGANRCREIVSDLLVVVKTKLRGGHAAVQDLQEKQRMDQQHGTLEQTQKSASIATLKFVDPYGPF